MAGKMIGSILLAFEESLETLAWLDDEAVMWVKDKADAIKFFVAYPDGISNPEKVNEIYKGLKISETDYSENLLRVNDIGFFITSLSSKMSGFGEAYTALCPYETNAFYNIARNQIWIPAGNIQKYYNPEFPRWLSYGGLGFTIGHELIHAFGEKGKEPGLIPFPIENLNIKMLLKLKIWY